MHVLPQALPTVQILQHFSSCCMTLVPGSARIRKLVPSLGMATNVAKTDPASFIVSTGGLASVDADTTNAANKQMRGRITVLTPLAMALAIHRHTRCPTHLYACLTAKWPGSKAQMKLKAFDGPS